MANIADVVIKIKGWSKLVDAGVVKEGDLNGKERVMQFVEVQNSLGYDYLPKEWDGFLTHQNNDVARIDTTGRWSMDYGVADLLDKWHEEYDIDYEWVAVENGCEYEDERGTEDLGLYVYSESRIEDTEGE